MISKSLQNQLDQHIPEREQQAFVELAVKGALNKHASLNTKQTSSKGDMIEIYADGGSRGNPGIAGGGFVVFKDGKNVLEGSEYFGEKTNNQSEYLSLRTALRETYERFPDNGIHCFMDSKLVVEQMKGNYKVKNANIRLLFEEVSRIASQFKIFKIDHIPREQNGLADALANRAMDRRS